MPPDSLARCSVLIVEDDSLVSAALVWLLKRRGYQPIAVGTVVEGLAALDGQRFAILDLNLPDGLGTTILERIRVEGRPIRVAVATGTTDEVLLADAGRGRPDLMLRKPYDVKVLIEWLDTAG